MILEVNSYTWNYWLKGNEHLINIAKLFSEKAILIYPLWIVYYSVSHIIFKKMSAEWQGENTYGTYGDR
jgi:hypothetical protein